MSRWAVRSRYCETLVSLNSRESKVFRRKLVLRASKSGGMQERERGRCDFENFLEMKRVGGLNVGAVAKGGRIDFRKQRRGDGKAVSKIKQILS
jgi:hypothetical protein